MIDLMEELETTNPLSSVPFGLGSGSEQIFRLDKNQLTLFGLAEQGLFHRRFQVYPSYGFVRKYGSGAALVPLDYLRVIRLHQL